MGGETSEGAVSLGIQPGAFARTILEVIRVASQPLCIREIAHSLAKRSGRPWAKNEERNLNNKISRGGFTAAFLMQCLQAIGKHEA
jgi:hypothetical protein